MRLVQRILPAKQMRQVQGIRPLKKMRSVQKDPSSHSDATGPKVPSTNKDAAGPKSGPILNIGEKVEEMRDRRNQLGKLLWQVNAGRSEHEWRSEQGLALLNTLARKLDEVDEEFAEWYRYLDSLDADLIDEHGNVYL